MANSVLILLSKVIKIIISNKLIDKLILILIIITVLTRNNY